MDLDCLALVYDPLIVHSIDLFITKAVTRGFGNDFDRCCLTSSLGHYQSRTRLRGHLKSCFDDGIDCRLCVLRDGDVRTEVPLCSVPVSMPKGNARHVEVL